MFHWKHISLIKIDKFIVCNRNLFVVVFVCVEVESLLEKGDEMFGSFGDVVSALNHALSELRVTDAARNIRANTTALGLKPYSARCQFLQATFDLFVV